MEYRKFGNTGKTISVITLGGMRFVHADDKPREHIPDDTLNQCRASVELAFKYGINHIETAHGYGKSETVYGMVLNEELKIPRNAYFLMTKGAPSNAREARQLVENQLRALQTGYVDFYAWHGINNCERFAVASKKNGPVEELHKMKEEGLIGHVGFSSHAPLDILLDSIETGLFDFMNLHYYYFFQRNIGAIDLARKKGLGIFIISPNDKGGQLFNAPQKLRKITSPLTPIQWNARFCLQNPDIHTICFGITEPLHFEEMAGIFPVAVPMNHDDLSILAKMDSQILCDKYAWYDGYDLAGDPSGINIAEVLRMRKMWKCYDMLEFGRYRYNLFEETHHWFPGRFATKENINKIDVALIPENIPLKEILLEAHQAFYKPCESDQ